MKIFTNKSIIHKIIFVLIILLLFSFIIPNCSKAAEGDGGIGGALFSPILDLLVGIADWFMSFIQQAIFGMNESLIHIDRGGEFWSNFWGIVITIVVVAACITLTVLSVGTGAGALAIAGAIAGSATNIAGVGVITFIAVKSITSAMLPNDFYLPIFQISPETIFYRRNSYF